MNHLAEVNRSPELSGHWEHFEVWFNYTCVMNYPKSGSFQAVKFRKIIKFLC